MASFHRNYSHLTFQTLTPSIRLQDFGCLHKKPVSELAQVKQWLVEVWADFEQSIVTKAIDQWKSTLELCQS